jgi:hypothetical protein
VTQSTADISAQVLSGVSGGGGGDNMDKMLSILMEDTRFFRIGEKQYEFHDNDHIFTLAHPSAKKENLMANGVCISCETKFKSSKFVCYW